ncbi:hypothetical protein WL95_10180 [Burkholderia cepacia]|nr:hypothetical protein WL95_10180 [Burkholderia cepacia]
MPCVHLAPRAAIRNTAFLRFHDLMHGAPHVSPTRAPACRSCLPAPRAPRGNPDPHARNEPLCVNDPNPSRGHHHEHAT